MDADEVSRRYEERLENQSIRIFYLLYVIRRLVLRLARHEGQCHLVLEGERLAKALPDGFVPWRHADLLGVQGLLPSVIEKEG